VGHRLGIDVIPDGHAVTLLLEGEVDQSSVGALRACMNDLDGAWRSVVLDMAGVTFIDSSGVGLLIQATRDFAVAFRLLELRNVPGQVQRVLELSGATEFVPTTAPF
jgi:anti-anti-sigma factor